MSPGSVTHRTFLIDWRTPGQDLDGATLAHQAFDQACRRMSAEGADARSIVSVFVPEQQRWLCLFAAKDEIMAYAMADVAQFPGGCVHAVVDMTDQHSDTGGQFA
ncbi:MULTISPECIES: hypothetical protein [unclassified Mycolicibacterium]|uniref:hypothetical protein n=1 Tax=unclassified Mycolicibacterium TaxID=2636767 RepID=UPI0012DD7EFF|nr:MULTISPECIES: hypothetical protein [unclassified Mycolicibacterium]MUM30467.1 hypothetical protein [Mycolicibacterium sp. CBMA 361]